MANHKAGKRNPDRIKNAPGTKNARPGRSPTLAAISSRRWAELHAAEIRRLIEEEGHEPILAEQKARQYMQERYRRKQRG